MKKRKIILIILTFIFILYYRDTVANDSWQEYGTNITVEPICNLELVKTEPPDTYENYEDNPTTSNFNDAYCNEYNCNVCYKVFYDKEEFIVHKNLSHKNQPYVCPICKSKFSLNVHFSLHLHKHLDYLLPIENQSPPKSISRNSKKPYYNFKSSLEQKIQNKKLHTNNLMKSSQTLNADSNIILSKNIICKPFKCTNCIFATKSYTKFVLHQNICTDIPDCDSTIIDDTLFQCHLCTKSFVNKSSLNGHMRFHSLRGEIVSRRKFKPIRSRVNGYENADVSVEKSQNASPKKSVNVIKFYQCKECSRKFISTNKLNIHQLQHQKQMNCRVCKKQFFFKKRYEKHLLSHNDEPCKKGTKYTFVPKTVKIEKTEDKEQNHLKPFSCLYCKNVYKSKKSLGVHVRLYHAHLKPVVKSPKSTALKCKWCDAVITKCNLYRHIKSFHPLAKPVKCTLCPMKFKDFPSRKLHILQSHKS